MKDDINKLLTITKEHLNLQNNKLLFKIYEISNAWIIFPFMDNATKYGNCGVLVNKEDGSVSNFILPCSHNFELLENAKEIYLGGYINE